MDSHPDAAPIVDRRVEAGVSLRIAIVASLAFAAVSSSRPSCVTSPPTKVTVAKPVPSSDVTPATSTERATRDEAPRLVAINDDLCRVQGDAMDCLYMPAYFDYDSHESAVAHLTTAPDSCVGDRRACEQASSAWTWADSTRDAWAPLPPASRSERVHPNTSNPHLACVMVRDEVHCMGDGHATPLGREVVRSVDGRPRYTITRIPGMRADSLAVEGAGACVIRDGDEIVCWGAFESGSGSMPWSAAGASEPVVVGRMPSVRQLVVTEIGVCGLAGTRMRCWDALGRSTPRPRELENTGPIETLLYVDGWFCARARGTLRCTMQLSPDWYEGLDFAPSVRLPEGAGEIVAVRDQICTIDGRGIVQCLNANFEIGEDRVDWVAVPMTASVEMWRPRLLPRLGW